MLIHTILHDMEFEKVDEIKSHLHSSTLDLLDTIERWCEEQKSKHFEEVHYSSTPCSDGTPLVVSKSGKHICNSLCKTRTMEYADTAFTAVQNLIRETKEQIK